MSSPPSFEPEDHSQSEEENILDNDEGLFMRDDTSSFQQMIDAEAFLQEMGEKEGYKVIDEYDGQRTKRYATRRFGTSSDMCVFTVTEDPIGCTLEELRQKFAECEKEWKESACWADLQEELRRLWYSKGITVDRCILYGLGSPSWTEEEEDQLRTLTQLAAFISITKLIGKMDHLLESKSQKCSMVLIEKALCQQQNRPELYAQEPVMNNLDRMFLETLGIAIVEHPEAFELLTKNSFAYCPAAEQAVDYRTFAEDPIIYLGGDAATWVDEEGQLRSIYDAYYIPQYLKVKLDPNYKDYARVMTLAASAFMENRESHALPDMQRFGATHLTWRRV